MTFGKNKKISNQKGFTLIELMVIVFIIGVLAAVILASLHSAAEKAGVNSAFSSLKSAASSAYMCLLNGASSMTLSAPQDGDLQSICRSGGLPIDGYAKWPKLASNGWIYGNGSFTGNGFYWCDPYTASTSSNPPSCGNLDDENCGQSSGSGNFCYFLKNGSRKMYYRTD